MWSSDTAAVVAFDHAAAEETAHYFRRVGGFEGLHKDGYEKALTEIDG